MKHLYEIEEVKQKLNMGLIDYDKARELLSPILEDLNKSAAKIAKKHGRKIKLFTIAGLLR